MKKIVTILLSILLLTGCNEKQNINNIENNIELHYMGVNITPGEKFNTNRINKEYKKSTIKSCAGDGLDNVYNYENIEITAHDDGSGEKIQSIYFLNNEVQTDEKIKIDDSVELLTSTYNNIVKDNDEYTIKDNNMIISFITSNDKIISIEYSLLLD